MNKDYTLYVSDEIAVKAKENGFPVKENRDINRPAFFTSLTHWYNTPTTDQVCNWLREEKGIHISIVYNPEGKYDYYIDRDTVNVQSNINFSEYYDAVLESIDKALDILQ